MDVIKAAVQLGLKAQSTLAVSAEEGCHTYGQLLHSALSLSSEIKSLLHKTRNSDASNGPTSRDAALKSLHDLEGARVGIIAKPCAEFVVGMWATWLCRGIAVPLALSHPEAELLHVLTDADVAVVMGTPDYQTRLLDVAQKCSAQFCLLPQVPSFESHENVLTGALPSVGVFEQVLAQVTGLSAFEDETPGLIIYTSGTTGKPKGVVHTHSGMNAQVKMLTQAWEYSMGDRFLHCLPLHHVHGVFNGLLAPLYAGAMVEFLPKFSVRGVWKTWSDSYSITGPKAANAITVFTGVPTMYAYLLEGYKSMEEDAQKVAALAARQLRLMMCGSSALPQTVMNEWEKLTGHRLLERYGMTEFVMALSNPYHGERKPGTVGRPLPGVQVKIVEDDTSVPGVGELCVKSPSLFKEYWRQPQVTKDSFDEDGYFKTGDSVTMDKDGYYVILGRSSVDILKVGGYKLSALEIEAVLLEHPAIAECAVLGLPDVYYGEAICAVVVLTEKAKSEAMEKSEPALDLPKLQAWAKERLAPYKTPAKLQIWELMPRNAMGKVNKKELKKLLTNENAL